MKTEQILKVVSSYYDKTPQEAVTRSRKRELATIRHITRYFARLKNRDTLERVARATGCTNHANVLNSVRVVHNLMDVDKSFHKEIDEIDHLIRLTG